MVKSIASGVAGVKKSAAQVKFWTKDHRKALVACATTALTVAWVFSPEPSGKIVGAALLSRNLATLGFGSTRLGLAIACSMPILASSVAGKVGADSKPREFHREG